MHTTEHTRGGYTPCKIVYTDATTGEECEIPHVCLVQARREAARIFDQHYSVRVVEVILE